MPTNPQNPQPPFAEPGKQRLEGEIEEPGSYRPQRDADPEPDAVDDDSEQEQAFSGRSRRSPGRIFRSRAAPAEMIEYSRAEAFVIGRSRSTVDRGGRGVTRLTVWAILFAPEYPA